jgi:hypothetical protein
MVKLMQSNTLIPAKAGIQLTTSAYLASWIPAFAGMTGSV